MLQWHDIAMNARTIGRVHGFDQRSVFGFKVLLAAVSGGPQWGG